MEENNFSYQFYQSTATAWEAMYQAILGAKKSIYWEIYILIDDVDGARFLSAICAKARAGVEVKIIMDSFGSLKLSNTMQTELKSSGVEILWYNRLLPTWPASRWFDRLWRRNHRKVLIIDEDVAFLGGVNVYAPARNWNDLHLKLTGPSIQPLLSAFAKTYMHCGGDKAKVSHLLPSQSGPDVGKNKIEFIVHSPKEKSSARDFYTQALDSAQESVTLLSPYYVPDRNFFQLLEKTINRGVKVNIILPWRSDVLLMNYAAETFFDLTDRIGASLYFLKEMNHGKALTIDNHTGLVGSFNLTSRSFFINEETGVVFKETAMVMELNSILENWKKDAVPLKDIDQSHTWGRFRKWWVDKVRDYL